MIRAAFVLALVAGFYATAIYFAHEVIQAYRAGDWDHAAAAGVVLLLVFTVGDAVGEMRLAR